MRRRVAGEGPWRGNGFAHDSQLQADPARLASHWPLLLARILNTDGRRRTNRNRARRHRRRLQQRREENQKGCHARQHVFKVARHPMLH